jgi:hypothetical protein
MERRRKTPVHGATFIKAPGTTPMNDAQSSH